MKKWKKLSSKIIFTHPRLILSEDRVRLPGGHETDYLTFQEGGDYVTVICIDKSGKMLINKEHTYTLNDALLQFPEGGIDLGEPVEKAARRELQEETGYIPKDAVEIGSAMSHHRRNNTRQRVVIATGLKFDHQSI